MISKKWYLFLFATILWVGWLPADESAFSLDSVGARVGFGDENGQDFISAEAFVLVDTPWEWSLSDSLDLEIELEGAVGALDGDDDTAAMAHLGIVASLEFSDFPISFVASSGPTYLSESEFGEFDIGGNFHFTSAGGFDVDIGEHWTIGYRIMHISNAGIEDTNPGLDLHAVTGTYDF